MYGQIVLCEIAKDTFEIPHNISYPYIERYDCAILYNVENLRAHRFTSAYASLRRYGAM